MRLALRRTTTALAAGMLATGVVVAWSGAVDTVDADPATVAPRALPPWAEPCQHREPRHDRELLRVCARVDGRVLKVDRRVGSPGAPEIHLAVIAHFHLFVVKLDSGQRAPSLGSRLTVVGPLVRASNGLREVDAVQVAPA